MSDVLILGGGFAGVWAAAAAARVREQSGAALSVTLLAPGDDLVIRPRLYEANPQKMRVSLDRVLSPVGVRRVAATATGIDTASRAVRAVDRAGQPRTYTYERLVLATGSLLRRPTLPGAEFLFDVDTLPGAAALDLHMRRLPAGPGRFTAVVVGTGFTGLEVATDLAGRLQAAAAEAGAGSEQARVVLVDCADVVGPDLGPGPRPAIESALAELGVESRLGRSLASLTDEGAVLSDGTELAARTVVWTAGIQASPLTFDVPGRHDKLGRLFVDEHLRVPTAPTVFAAGDTAAALAEPGHHVMPSCQHAIPLGEFVGHNVAADLLGLPLEAFKPDPYRTCLDLGPAGAVSTAGWDRIIQLTGPEAKRRKRMINEHWIYPPLDDPAEILRAADHGVAVVAPIPS